MKKNLSKQAVRAMAIGMAVMMGSTTAISGVVNNTVVKVYAQAPTITITNPESLASVVTTDSYIVTSSGLLFKVKNAGTTTTGTQDDGTVTLLGTVGNEFTGKTATNGQNIPFMGIVEENKLVVKSQDTSTDIFKFEIEEIGDGTNPLAVATLSDNSAPDFASYATPSTIDGNLISTSVLTIDDTNGLTIKTNAFKGVTLTGNLTLSGKISVNEAAFGGVKGTSSTIDLSSASGGTIDGKGFTTTDGSVETTFGTLKLKDFTSKADSFNNVTVTTLLEFLGTTTLQTASSFKPSTNGNTIKKLVLPTSFSGGVDGLFAVNTGKYTIETIDLTGNTNALTDGTFKNTNITNLVHNGKALMNGATITNLTFANDITNIETNAFKGATIPAEITLDNITTIGANAFDIAAPESVTINLNAYTNDIKTNFDANAFGSTKTFIIKVPYTVTQEQAEALKTQLSGNSNITVTPNARPTIQSGVIEDATSNQITLTFSENIKVASTGAQPTPTDFTVKVNGEPNTVTAISNIEQTASNRTLTLTLAKYVTQGQEVKLSYNKTTNAILNEAGAELDNVQDMVITNNSQNQAPTIQSGVIENVTPNKITLTFSENIKVASNGAQPTPTDFTVKVNGQANTVTAISSLTETADNNTLTLTLTTPVTQGQEVKLSYTKTDNAILDTVGAELSNIIDTSALNVENNVGIAAENEFIVAVDGVGTYIFEKLTENTVALKGFQSSPTVVIENRTVANTFENGVLKTATGDLYLTKIGTGIALTEITNKALAGNTAYVTEISAEAFNGNTVVTELSFPNVSNIGNNAFNGATALATLTIGTNVSEITIGDSAFASTSALTTVNTNKAAETVVNQKLNTDSAGNGSLSSTTIDRKSVRTDSGTYVFEVIDSPMSNLKLTGGFATLVDFSPVVTPAPMAIQNTITEGVATIGGKTYLLTKIGNGVDSITTIPEDFLAFNEHTSAVREIADNAFKGGCIPSGLILPMADRFGSNAFADLKNTKPFEIYTGLYNTTKENASSLVPANLFGTNSVNGTMYFLFGTNVHDVNITNTNIKKYMLPMTLTSSSWLEDSAGNIIPGSKKTYELDFSPLNELNAEKKAYEFALTEVRDVIGGQKAKIQTDDVYENALNNFMEKVTHKFIDNTIKDQSNVTFINGIYTDENKNRLTLTQVGGILTEAKTPCQPIGSVVTDELIGEHMAQVKVISPNAFEGANQLKELKFPRVEFVGANAFKGSTLTKLDLGTGHNDAITVDPNAFAGATSLNNVNTNKASETDIKEALQASNSNATINKPNSSSSDSSSGGSGGSGGSAVIVAKPNDVSTETTSESNNANDIYEHSVENKQLTLDVIKLPSAEGEAKVFGDVSSNHWANTYIDKLSTAGIINGANGMFNPNGQTKRADVTIMLVNLLGLSPEVNDKFTDVNPNSYYAPYVGTASTYGIVNGSNGMFNPEGIISRQDTMVMIGQILKSLDLNVNTDTTSLNQFSDVNNVAPYANESVAILVNSGIISGNNGRLNPKAPVTRAEMATIMSKLYDVLDQAK